MSNHAKHYDVIVVGAGIVGCCTARALSRYRLKVLVLEAQDDISCGASKANSGIIHAGYDCYPGTLKARLNVEGAGLFHELAQELDIPFEVNGSLVLCFHEEEHHQLEKLYQRGIENSVGNIELIDADLAYKIEPRLAPGLHSALWAKSAAIVSPYEAAIAFAENAAENGVEFLLEAALTDLRAGPPFALETAKGTFTADVVVNTAGIEADTVHNYVAKPAEAILPQRGEYYLLDKAHKGYVNCTLFPLPGPSGKGVLIAPTVDGNTIIGPNAENLTERHETQTTSMGLSEILEKGGQTVADLPIYGRITTFAGIRAKHGSKDFIINEPLPGFVNALGIDSPGLSAAPAIGKRLVDMVTSRLQPEINKNFMPERTGIKRFATLSFEEMAALIKDDPNYGHIVCRCEMVTEAEIIDAIRRPLGARNLGAIKRRTRAQMGRCQGGFCSIKLAEILSRELDISEESIWTF